MRAKAVYWLKGVFVGVSFIGLIFGATLFLLVAYYAHADTISPYPYSGSVTVEDFPSTLQPADIIGDSISPGPCYADRLPDGSWNVRCPDTTFYIHNDDPRPYVGDVP